MTKPDRVASVATAGTKCKNLNVPVADTELQKSPKKRSSRDVKRENRPDKEVTKENRSDKEMTKENRSDKEMTKENKPTKQKKEKLTPVNAADSLVLSLPAVLPESELPKMDKKGIFVLRATAGYGTY